MYFSSIGMRSWHPLHGRPKGCVVCFANLIIFFAMVWFSNAQVLRSTPACARFIIPQDDHGVRLKTSERIVGRFRAFELTLQYSYFVPIRICFGSAYVRLTTFFPVALEVNAKLTEHQEDSLRSLLVRQSMDDYC